MLLVLKMYFRLSIRPSARIEWRIKNGPHITVGKGLWREKVESSVKNRLNNQFSGVDEGRGNKL